jgi:hypothetical protein
MVDTNVAVQIYFSQVYCNLFFLSISLRVTKMKKVVLAACFLVTVGLAIAGPPVQAKSAEDGKEAPIKPAELGKEAPIPPPGKQGPGWPQFPGKDGPGVFGKQGPRPPKEKGERKGKEHKKGKHEKGGWKKPPKPYEMDETKKALHDERRKSSGLYAALILPKKPKEISFPLSEEDSKKFYAARDGLMDWVRETSKEHDLQNEDTKKSLRQKTTDNQVRESVGARQDDGYFLNSSHTHIPHESS